MNGINGCLQCNEKYIISSFPIKLHGILKSKLHFILKDQQINGTKVRELYACTYHVKKFDDKPLRGYLFTVKNLGN